MTRYSRSKFGKIGGSTIASIVGENPWETALGAYFRLRGEVSPTPDNIAMARGRRYEPVVAAIFQCGRPELRVARNRRGTDEPEYLEHPKYPYLIGRPDAILFDSKSRALVAGLEIKTTHWSNRRKWGAEGTDAIPKNYLLQCQWYAGLMKLPEWRVAVAFLDDDGIMTRYGEYLARADEELFETLVERAVDFWENHIVPGVPPEMERVDEATERWLLERFPNNVAPLDVATEAEERLMADYLAKRAALDAARTECEKSEFALKSAIGERDGLRSETFGKVTWKRSKDYDRVDYRAVCEELNPSEELLAKCRKRVEGTRRFVFAGSRSD
ncbi:MAG: YqaJ viral recombinase family protein [Thermoguttaceae bacterium]|nr:YqaJ viral recombinase family protein [Thermoguttaceae bacterium]